MFRGIGPQIYLDIEIVSGDLKVLEFKHVDAQSFVDRYKKQTFYLCRVPSGRHHLEMRISIAEITVRNKGETKLVRVEEGYVFTITETTTDGRVFKHRTMYAGPHVSVTKMSAFIAPGEVRMCYIDLGKYFVMKYRQARVIELMENLTWQIDSVRKFNSVEKFQYWAWQNDIGVVQTFKK